jgi:hypothetical protein|tara:strand:+ start:172 stop:405 length:234 start_codon:yes stop_codon:yes gene_type:complete
MQNKKIKCFNCSTVGNESKFVNFIHDGAIEAADLIFSDDTLDSKRSTKYVPTSHLLTNLKCKCGSLAYEVNNQGELK